MRHRIGGQILNPQGFSVSAKAKSSRRSKLKTKARTQPLPLPREGFSYNGISKKASQEVSTRDKPKRRRRVKASKRKRSDIQLPSSPSDSSAEGFGQGLMQSSSQDSKFDELLQRVKERNVANLPMVEIDVIPHKIEKKRDVVQEVYDRVKQSRIDKAAKVALG